MTKRRNTTMHEECLRAFGVKFRKEVGSDLKFWKAQKSEVAETRRATYAHVLFLLKEAAAETGVPLQDIGVEDFET